MQEGIRLGNASDYNVVTGNFVHNLPVGGRGITTDQDSSFNLITMNTADSLSIGYNEEMSGWSNVWTYNTVSNANIVGFSIRMVDSSLTAPSQNSSSYNITMSCNTSTSSHKDFQAGALSGGTFAGNSFSTYQVNPRLTAYWGSAGNTWNGISTAPKTGVTSPGTTSGC